MASRKAPLSSKPGRLYPDRPIVGCLAVTRRRDTVLLARRSLPPGVGKWGFPGGLQELGETLFECAQRELIEETGVMAEPRAVLTAIEAIREDDKGKIMTHFTLVCVLLDWHQGEGEPLQDAEQVGWYSLAEAQKLDTFPDTVSVMRLALK